MQTADVDIRCDQTLRYPLGKSVVARPSRRHYIVSGQYGYKSNFIHFHQRDILDIFMD